MRQCRVCGCSDDNCADCIKRNGTPCSWIELDLCSACAAPNQALVQDLTTYLAQALDVPGVMIVVLDKSGGLHIGAASEQGGAGLPLRSIAEALDAYVKKIVANGARRAAAGEARG